MDTPVSAETLKSLQTAAEAAEKHGDRAIALILAGVRLYAELGREYELLEGMRHFAEEMDEAVRNTPTAEQLRTLYGRDE